MTTFDNYSLIFIEQKNLDEYYYLTNKNKKEKISLYTDDYIWGNHIYRFNISIDNLFALREKLIVQYHKQYQRQITNYIHNILYINIMLSTIFLCDIMDIIKTFLCNIIEAPHYLATINIDW